MRLILILMAACMLTGCVVPQGGCQSTHSQHMHAAPHHYSGHRPHPRPLQYDEPQHPVVMVDGSTSLIPHSVFAQWIGGHASGSTP